MSLEIARRLSADGKRFVTGAETEAAGIFFTLEAEASSDAQVSEELDTRGVGSLGGYWEYIDDGPHNGGPDLYVLALTRRPGKPWMLTQCTTSADSGPNHVQQFASQGANGRTLPQIKAVGFLCLAAISVVCVIPVNEAGSPSDAEAVTSFDNPDADVTYHPSEHLLSLGNLISIELVHPGVPNSPISVSSETGWDHRVLLATDGDGAIVTDATALGYFLNTGGLLDFHQSVFDTPVEPHAPLFLTGGGNGDPVPAISYRLSNES